MPSYTYTGLDDSITLRGITFAQGSPVEIVDAGFEKKLDNLPYFSSDKPEALKEVADSLKDDTPEVQELKRKIYALQTENASLRKQILEYTSEALAEEEPEPEPEPVELESFDPNEPEETVEIPADWREWHWKRRMVLAKNFSDGGDEIKNGEDADFIIEQELAARGNG